MLATRVAWWLIFIGLSPILLLEAVYARWCTPRLPEAKEPTKGRNIDTTLPSLDIAFIGESTIAGVGASDMTRGLTGRTMASLNTHYTLSWTIIGHNGIRIAELQPYLTAEEFSGKQVIVVAIGANDTTKFTSYGNWIEGLNDFVDVIRSYTDAPIIFSQLPPMHLFTALPQPLRAMVGQRAKLFDGGLQGVCAQANSCHYLPLNFEPKPGYLASDGYHPSELAYQEWGERMAIVIHELMQH